MSDTQFWVYEFTVGCYLFWPLMVVAGLLIVCDYFRRYRIGYWLGSIILVVNLVVGTAQLWHWHKIAVVKDYSAHVAPLLDAYKKEHGEYPESLYTIEKIPELPYRLYCSASTDNKTEYHFSYQDPMDLMGGSQCA